MTLPCEQFDLLVRMADDVPEWDECRCGADRHDHDLAAAIRAEQAEALAAKDREIAEGTRAQQLIADILAERADELTKEACDRCDQCGPTVMCGFHSVLSTLQRQAWTNGALERDRLKAHVAAKDREIADLTAALAATHRDMDSERDRRVAAQEAITNQYAPQVSTLTALVQALETWVRGADHPDSCDCVEIRDDGDGRVDRWIGSRRKCSCGLDALRALLTQEPTP